MTTHDARQRRDVYVENDSSGFSIIPSSALDRIIEDNRRNDRAIVMDNQAVLMALYGDDSFPARLVVGGPLSADEEAEWLARVSWKLSIPSGSVLLCGGFDPRTLTEWRDRADDWEGTVHSLDVPPGDYRADVNTYRATINGRFFEDAWPVKLGAWFRREHAGKPYPAWLINELEIAPELDPGHEEEWSESGSEDREVDESLEYVIGYLVHLQPWNDGGELSPLPDDGWFLPEEVCACPCVVRSGYAPTPIRAEDVEKPNMQ